MKRRQVILVLVLLTVAAATLLSRTAVSRTHGADATGSGEREQWEYLIIGGGGNVNLTPTENTSMRKESGAFAREDFVLESNLDKLGRNGWELVTVTDLQRPGAMFIFKRRK